MLILKNTKLSESSKRKINAIDCVLNDYFENEKDFLEIKKCNIT